LATEYLSGKHGIEASRETVRQWMMRAKLWRGKKAKVKQVHLWRPRRSRLGELVQWDTSVHDWLEGRGEQLYLIAMIDDATSRLFARFVRHDSTEENMKLLWSYLEKFGRPLAFYTDKASLFQTAEKRKRAPNDPRVEFELSHQLKYMFKSANVNGIRQTLFAGYYRDCLLKLKGSAVGGHGP
jgi:transposase-like protein